MASTGSIRIVKSFNYRGTTRDFNNRYAFTGHAPSGGAEWEALADAVVDAEKEIYVPPNSGGAQIVQAVGYAPGSEVPVFTKNYTTDGVGTFTDYGYVPGDVAGLIRYSTAARSSKNHPIYLFNYYHTIGYESGGIHADAICAAQKSAMQDYADLWLNGMSDGTNFYTRTSPTGHNATGYTVESLLTHRDLPR